MRRRSIERRLFEAAMFVLGTAACYHSPPPAEPSGDMQFAQPPDERRDPTEQEARPPADDERADPTTTTTTTNTTTTTTTTNTTNTNTTNTTSNPTNPNAAPDANRLCATYKASSRVNKAKAKRSPGHGRVGESAYWDGNRGVAVCTIVREQVDVTITVTRTPTCCPSGMPPGHQCPPSYKANVPGTRVLVEHAELAADGTAAKSSLVSYEIEKQPEIRHNCGRRPEALQLLGEARAADDVGGELAAMAELEAASVPAFERLARELAAHDAPSELVERAHAAARDEVEHARAIGELAARYGARPRAVAVPALPIRTLEAIAIENAVEGCVREAYGALVATYQAERASPALRSVFRAIAVDERRHAALADAVDDWLDGRLSPTQRAAVALAKSAAQDQLRAALASSAPCELLGVPDSAVAVALFDAYFEMSVERVQA